jgi:hypothetical protein
MARPGVNHGQEERVERTVFAQQRIPIIAAREPMSVQEVERHVIVRRRVGMRLTLESEIVPLRLRAEKDDQQRHAGYNKCQNLPLP